MAQYRINRRKHQAAWHRRRRLARNNGARRRKHGGAAGVAIGKMAKKRNRRGVSGEIAVASAKMAASA